MRNELIKKLQSLINQHDGQILGVDGFLHKCENGDIFFSVDLNGNLNEDGGKLDLYAMSEKELTDLIKQLSNENNIKDEFDFYR